MAAAGAGAALGPRRAAGPAGARARARGAPRAGRARRAVAVAAGGPAEAATAAAEEAQRRARRPAPSKARVRRAARAPPSKDQLWDWLAREGGGAREHDWGRVLDAGTGVDSLKWVASLACDWENTVAVTASASMRDRMLRELGEEMYGVRTEDIVMVHNWSKIKDVGVGADARAVDGPNGAGGVAGDAGASEAGEGLPYARAMGEFDTVLADYLFGSLEYFWPFNEENLMDLLVERIAPGGTLLFIGREPFEYPSKSFDALPEASRLVLETERLRDGAMLLSHQRAYREFPERAIRESLARRGLRVDARAFFRIRHTVRSLSGQLAWAEAEAKRVPNPALSAALLERIREVRAEADACEDLRKGHYLGGNYALICSREAEAEADGR